MYALLVKSRRLNGQMNINTIRFELSDFLSDFLRYSFIHFKGAYHFDKVVRHIRVVVRL